MRLTALVVAAAALFVARAAMANGYDDFTGNWRNESPDGGLTRVQVTDGGGGLLVRGFGQCTPTDCNWGQVDAVAYSQNVGSNPVTDAKEIMATFNTGFSQTILILDRIGGDRLRFGLYTRFNDGRSPYVKHGTLRRTDGGVLPPGGSGLPPGVPGGPGSPSGPDAPGVPGGGLRFSEDCINFDWHDVVAQNSVGWRVSNGSSSMLFYGPDGAGANRAAEIIRHYRFSAQCFIGRPGPSMRYWKRGSNVPSGGYPGADCISSNPDTTEARFVAGEWKLVDGGRWMLSFGANEIEARQAEEVVRRYNLNRQCWVGNRGDSQKMNYWLSD